MQKKFADYIGIPYLSKGRDQSLGLDCWGLILLVSREQFGHELPDYTGYQDAGKPTDTEPFFTNRKYWRAIPFGDEQAGDVIVMLIAGSPCHAGIVIKPGWMLHTFSNHDAALDRYNGNKWNPRIEGFYRWVR